VVQVVQSHDALMCVWNIFPLCTLASLCICLQVCELDIIFNFEKAYFILDELLLGGEIQETSKKNVLKAIAAQDLLQEVSYGNVPIEL
jgi:hypothetical protein